VLVERELEWWRARVLELLSLTGLYTTMSMTL
jgi:hypothetical protein